MSGELNPINRSKTAIAHSTVANMAGGFTELMSKTGTAVLKTTESAFGLAALAGRLPMKMFTQTLATGNSLLSSKPSEIAIGMAATLGQIPKNLINKGMEVGYQTAEKTQSLISLEPSAYINELEEQQDLQNSSQTSEAQEFSNKLSESSLDEIYSYRQSRRQKLVDNYMEGLVESKVHPKIIERIQAKISSNTTYEELLLIGSDEIEKGV